MPAVLILKALAVITMDTAAARHEAVEIDTTTGTIAASFPYLDNTATRRAGIPPGPAGETMLNYPRSELDAIQARHAGQGWQMAFHVNGDMGLDGTMFTPEIGSQWMRAGDAACSGASVSFHNDGCVSPPIPLLNVQAMVTRRTAAGRFPAANQAVLLHEAFLAHTRTAAFQIGRDRDLGSIEVGKCADFVERSADPFTAGVNRLTDLTNEAAGRHICSHVHCKENQ